MRRRALVFSIFVVLLGLMGGAVAGANGYFVTVGPMVVNRISFSLVRLADGTVLAVGGSLDIRAELYDPGSSTFSVTGSLNRARTFGARATLLQDGNVLVTGGHDSSFLATDSAELYDPLSAAFSPTGNMTTPRSEHTETLLPDGNVLIVGGHRFNFPNSALASAELYDPMTQTFTATGSMLTPRQNHTATLLVTGQVLITGGFNASQIGLASAELYDPITGTFSPTGDLAAGRGEHTATPLNDGSVLVAGGYIAFPGGAWASAELYDPVTGVFSPAGMMTNGRGSHTATPLADGTVLIAGGFTAFPFAPTVADAEVYDPAAGSFTVVASMVQARGRHAAAALSGGDVLVAGGFDQFGNVFRSAELYTAENLPSVARTSAGNKH